jgi:hypothetical protein
MESWTIMPCAVVFDSSCANLTRASIEEKAFNPRGWIVGISAFTRSSTGYAQQ